MLYEKKIYVCDCGFSSSSYASAKEHTCYESQAKKTGAAIMDLRQRNGLSRAALGDAIGFSAQTVGGFERGTHPLNINTLANIAKCLGVSIQRLV